VLNSGFEEKKDSNYDRDNIIQRSFFIIFSVV
jgi:hypothetical protein